MANCKDNCIHYKVCMYGDLTEYKTEQILKDDCDDFMPKDVVPKSEVEALKHQLEMIIDEGEYWQGKYLNARLEVAREIFEEIERVGEIYENRAETVCYFPNGFLAELKKKYTESEDKG